MRNWDTAHVFGAPEADGIWSLDGVLGTGMDFCQTACLEATTGHPKDAQPHSHQSRGTTNTVNTQALSVVE